MPAQLAADLSAEIAAAAGEKDKGQAMDWALQAYIPARDVAYKNIPAPNGNDVVVTLGQPYQNAAAPVVRQQIARAGVRLANALQAKRR
jgi:S1/P1 Nuclease